jgi:stage V sporulation protein B
MEIENFFSFISEEIDLIKDSIIVLLSISSSAIILFLTNLYFSKLFGPTLFGNFKIILSLFVLLPTLADLGFSTTLPKYIAEFRAKNKRKIGYMVRSFLKIRIINFLVLLSLLFLLRDQITIYFLHDPALSYLVLAGLFVVGSNFFIVLRQMVMGYEKFKLYSLSNISEAVVYALVGITLGYYFGIFYALIGYAFASFIGSIICLKFLSSQHTFELKSKFDLRPIFFGYSLPIYFLDIPNNLGTSMVPLLSLFFPITLIGYYSFAFLFYYASMVIPSSLGVVLLPKVSRLGGIKKHGEAHKSLKRVLMAYSLVVILGISLTLLFSEWFVSLIAKEYLPGLIFFKVLICLGLLLGYAVIYASYFSAQGRIKRTALVVLLQNLLLFVVSFILLKSF